MKILLVAATSFEIASLLPEHPLKNGHIPDISHHEIHYLITGIGMTAMTFSLTNHIAHNTYDLIINAGICGSFRENLSPGSIVQVFQEYFADMGAENGDSFLTPADLGMKEFNIFPFRDGLLEVEVHKKFLIFPETPLVRGITSDLIHGNPESIARIRDQYKPDVESMEGAACFYVCISKNIPCLQIRSISNYVAPRKELQWEIKKAVLSLQEYLIRFLHAI